MVKQYQICQAATKLFLQNGFDNVSMTAIARESLVEEAELFTLFGNKQDIILFLYQTINIDWQIIVSNISEKKLALRFELTLLAKLELLQPYADLLGDMVGILLRNPKIGINSPRTSHIRMIGLQTMQQVVAGSSDCKSLKKKVHNLPALLYIIHWAILFLQIQSNDKTKPIELAKLASKMLKQVNNFSFLAAVFPLFNELSSWANSLVNESDQLNSSINQEIIKILFNHRKVSEAGKDCQENNCEVCQKQHYDKINHFTQQDKPLHFILPAFPAKSPNQTKVLGKLPDLGEKIALMALEDLCKEIKSIYAPGAYITICSDGRIFSELVGVTDIQVTNYVAGIKVLISKSGLKHIQIVNLEDLITGESFDELRNNILQTYAEPLEDLTRKLKIDPEFKTLFNGIHRFITDDRKWLEHNKSDSRIKEEAKIIALKVIQHSNAWTRFLGYVYPEAIRLSIHPYPSHSDKIGIQLTKAVNNWITPWHGVIVLQEDGYLLMKKSEAEAKQAKLIMEDNQPYYYTLIQD